MPVTITWLKMRQKLLFRIDSRSFNLSFFSVSSVDNAISERDGPRSCLWSGDNAIKLKQLFCYNFKHLMPQKSLDFLLASNWKITGAIWPVALLSGPPARFVTIPNRIYETREWNFLTCCKDVARKAQNLLMRPADKKNAYPLSGYNFLSIQWCIYMRTNLKI